MYTNRVFRTAKCVLFIEVSSFQGVLIRGVSAYADTNIYLDIFFRPLIQTNGLNFGHVCSKTTMNATAVYADEDTETDIRPVWICVCVCVCVCEMCVFVCGYV